MTIKKHVEDLSASARAWKLRNPGLSSDTRGVAIAVGLLFAGCLVLLAAVNVATKVSAAGEHTEADGGFATAVSDARGLASAPSAADDGRYHPDGSPPATAEHAIDPAVIKKADGSLTVTSSDPDPCTARRDCDGPPTATESRAFTAIWAELDDDVEDDEDRLMAKYAKSLGLSIVAWKQVFARVTVWKEARAMPTPQEAARYQAKLSSLSKRCATTEREMSDLISVGVVQTHGKVSALDLLTGLDKATAGTRPHDARTTACTTVFGKLATMINAGR